MRTEEECPSNQRYLFGDVYFSDNGLAIWKNEVIKRHALRQKDWVYERYINWQKTDNEIAIFTWYAYAEFALPKKFDIIFQTDKPENFINVNYELVQSLYEGWIPLDRIEDGHKHVCILRFENTIPDILYSLHRVEKINPNHPIDQTMLGFCNSADFTAIKQRIYRKQNLKSIYGNEWTQYDNEE